MHDERYIPDVGFIRKSTQPEPCHEAYNPNPPELAVEVVSPSDNERKLLVKLSNYLAAGAVVWMVYADTREVHIHQPGESVVILGTDGTLTTDILPGFTLAVQDIFPQS